MSDRARGAVLTGLLTFGGMTAGCSSPDRPTVRSDASRPASCPEALDAAFPGGHRGTLPAYREVERLCPSLAELAPRKAFQGSILRLDCAPADIRAIGAEIPELGREVPGAPADLVDTALCRQFNQECADYEELRRDHAAVARNPTVANRGLYVHDQALFQACTQKYG
ncbi:MAG: hypothetical protein QOD57_4919 [Actinomycetota bacterium]|nr:hypothetical protein [Actinomycetota bacterium]